MKHANTYKLNYSDLLKNQPKSRKLIVEKLDNYLQNPGGFSILLLGKRGTGKSFWLERIQKKNIKVSNSKDIKYINSRLHILANPRGKQLLCFLKMACKQFGHKCVC